MATVTFTLDKDTPVSDPIALADTPMQISITKDSTWTYNKTTVGVQEETETEGVYKEIAGVTIKYKEDMNPLNLKPKNYKVVLTDYSDTDSVTFIVS